MYSLATKGRIDFDLIVEKTGKSLTEVHGELLQLTCVLSLLIAIVSVPLNYIFHFTQ